MYRNNHRFLDFVCKLVYKRYLGVVATLFPKGVTILLLRSLNPLLARYFFENCNIQPQNDIYPDSVDAKSTSVVTFWRQGFVEDF